mmetsp:Transcript_19466/g.64039  ORF Transcript_19466/g.64039 Transcript_19466/m.64039 type:complete len:798 (+) Transcript_19466:675-3068(+)
MPEEPEARDVRAGRAAVLLELRRRRAVALGHGREALADLGGPRQRAHVAREDRARAERLREDQRVARDHALLGQEGRAAVRHAVDGEAQPELRALARVAADQSAARGVQRDARAGHELEERVLDAPVRPVGHDDERQRRRGQRAHGVAVRERVVRGDLPKDVGVRHERPEEVDGMDDLGPLVLLGAVGDDGAVVGRVDADDDVAGRRRAVVEGQRLRQVRQRARERGRADLGAAAAAAHGRRLEHGERVAAGLRRRREGREVAVPLREVGQPLRVLPHPLAVDPVLEVPEPGRLDGEAAPRRDGGAVARAQQAEERRLGHVRERRRPADVRDEVRVERHARHDGEDAGLGPRVAVDGRAVARGVDARRRARPRDVAREAAPLVLVDPQKPVRVDAEARRPEPGRRRGLRAPDALVEGHGRRGAVFQAAREPGLAAGRRRDGLEGLVAVEDVHAGPVQRPGHERPHARRVAPEQLRAPRDEREAREGIRVLAERLELPAHARDHGQGQLDAAGAAADDDEVVGRPVEGPARHLLEQAVPLLGERRDGLDGREQRRRRRRRALGRDADVDGEHVVGDARPRRVLEDELLGVHVDARDLAVDQPAPREARERVEVDVALVAVVKPGDVAREHAAVGRLHVAGHQSQPDALERLHAQHAQHVHVAVAAADQDEVRQLRRRVGLHALLHHVRARLGLALRGDLALRPHVLERVEPVDRVRVAGELALGLEHLEAPVPLDGQQEEQLAEAPAARPDLVRGERVRRLGFRLLVRGTSSRVAKSPWSRGKSSTTPGASPPAPICC